MIEPEGFSPLMSSTPTSRHANPAKQERSQRNLEKIVLAAETVLSRDGWEAFTMKAVADEARASVGGIYRRFASKEQLLRAIKDNVLTRADGMHKDIAAHKAKDLAGALSYYGRARVDALLTYADILRKILDAQQRSDVVMENRGRQSVQLGLRTFRSVVAPHRTEIKHEDPELAIEFAFYIFNASVLRKMQGYGSDTIFDHFNWDVMKAELTTVMVRYLKGGPK
jgi:AcrR family transcriptional regulator